MQRTHTQKPESLRRNAPSLSPFQARAEKHQVRKERGAGHIKKNKSPVRRVRRSHVALRQQQKRTDHEVRLITGNDSAAVNSAKRGTSRSPVRNAVSNERASQELHEYWPTRARYQRAARFDWCKEQHAAGDTEAQR